MLALAQNQPTTTTRTRSLLRASIIIVNYNGGELLKQCLRSLVADEYQHDEIIVLDNASTDGSADSLENLFPHIQVIRSGANLGFGEGNNVAVQAATGRYLAFLNPDTIVEPGWLDALIAALEADPAAGLATSQILLMNDPGRINTCGCDIHLTGLSLCRGVGQQQDALALQEEVGSISGAAFVMRRNLYAALGGFDGSFFLYMEDTDLSWRARLAGYGTLYVPTSVIHHHYTLRFGPKKTFYQERNRYLMLLKSLRWPTFLALWPALLLAEIITWGFVVLRDRQNLRNKLDAYAWMVHHWDEIMERRRHVQATRQRSDRALLAICTHHLAYEQTGGGLVVKLSHSIFDPLFLSLQRLAQSIIRW